MVSVNSWAVRRAVGCGAVIVAGLLVGCNNNPWQDDAAASNTLYSAVIENSPRHLDPTASYWSNDTPYTYQIYEPPYAYHYLKRPFQLIPKSAREVVKPYYVDKNGQRLPDDAPAEMVAESIYDVPIKPGILYQPHPALAKDDKGNYVYHAMKPGELGERRTPLDFEHQGTRELVAEDFVYALKRQATTRITAPIFSTFAEYVVGLKEYGELVKLEDAKLRGREVVVEVLALRILREGRVRRKANARLDGHVVHALGNGVGARIVRQARAGLVEVVRLHDGGGRLGNQLVRALQVVVAVERLIRRHGVRRLGVQVRRGRVEVTRRAFIERVEDEVGGGCAFGIRAVVAAGDRARGGQDCKQPHSQARAPLDASA